MLCMISWIGDWVPSCSWKQKLGMEGQGRRLSCKRKVGLFSEHVGWILDGELSDDSGERSWVTDMIGTIKRRLNSDIAIGFSLYTMRSGFEPSYGIYKSLTPVN
jgi:hypothetical protein